MTSVGFVFANVCIKAVTSVEELAYVSPDAVLKNKASARVLTDKGADIQYELVQNDKFFSLVVHKVVKVGPTKVVNLLESLQRNIFLQSYSIDHLASNQDYQESYI